MRKHIYYAPGEPPLHIIRAGGATYTCQPNAVHGGRVIWSVDAGPVCPACGRTAS